MNSNKTILHKKSVFLLILLMGSIQFSYIKNAEIPYNLDKKPVPKGSNFDKLLPKVNGAFERTKYKPPRPSFDGEALYEKGNVKVNLFFGLAKDYNDTQKTIKVFLMDAESPDVTEKISVLKKDPSYIKFISPEVSLFAWTRGFYYFKVECKSGKSDLDEFMNAFPY